MTSSENALKMRAKESLANRMHCSFFAIQPERSFQEVQYAVNVGCPRGR